MAPVMAPAIFSSEKTLLRELETEMRKSGLVYKRKWILRVFYKIIFSLYYFKNILFILKIYC